MTPNPKIRELIVSMGIIPESEHYDIAEQVIRECVIQCEREWIRHGADSAHNQAIHGCINSIKQHFGVK